MKHTARRTVRTNAAVLTAAAAMTLALGGCSSSENRLAEFRDDPTPDLITMHERGDDISNRLHLIKDESRRMLVRDWLYFWYLDRPTR
ncbi:MAG: hypothetical protein AAFO89_07595, partial [Planctomycetota bacterium]